MTKFGFGLGIGINFLKLGPLGETAFFQSTKNQSHKYSFHKFPQKKLSLS